MISILIPVHEVTVTKLVSELVTQCQKAKIDFEVLAFDDGSSDKIKQSNRSVLGIIGVNYVELSQNLGRRRIRNQLAKLARYDHLLFLDADSRILSKKYIRVYLKAITEHPNDVIAGGRIYSPNAPKDKSKLLHYLYGSQRESVAIKFRKRHPSRFFNSNNYVVPREVQLSMPYDVNIRGYGYEDLVMGKRFAKEGIAIRHIDNPVKHGKLRSVDDFLETTREAIENLYVLNEKYDMGHVRLQKAVNCIQSFRLAGPILYLLRSKHQQILDNLQSDRPKLFNYDLLRLEWLLSQYETQTTK